jgi:hypothetical protein
MLEGNSILSSSLEAQLEFLRLRGAGAQPHSFSSLLGHLVGTREILLSWKGSPELCTAGLFHSVYGTESFRIATVDPGDRATVQEVIGPASEQIVFLFSVMSQESFETALEGRSRYRILDRTNQQWTDLHPEMFRNLCNLSAANWLEQRQRLPESYRELGLERYRRMLGLVLPGATAALRAAYGFPEDDCLDSR